jgi:hypothetical protein
MGEQVAIQKKSKANCAYKKLSITNGSINGRWIIYIKDEKNVKKRKTYKKIFNDTQPKAKFMK